MQTQQLGLRLSRAPPNGEMTLGVFQGRELVLSPQWSDDRASVLFDSNSGDYWILSPLAREIVRHTADTGPHDTAAVIRHVIERTNAVADFDGSATTIRRVIDELVQLSILAHT